MVLKLFSRKEPADPYLMQPITTPRFQLINCSRKDALRITLPWREDQEVLHNLMMSKASYSPTAWARAIGKPDGSKVFFHAIVDKGANGTIGTHRVSIDRSGTASMLIVVHARSWWGKDVFEEVRSAILDHFSGSDRVMRFYGRVQSRNISSIYNYTKLGFRLIGHDTCAWLSPVTGEHHDTVHFELMANDWRAKRGLEMQS